MKASLIIIAALCATIFVIHEWVPGELVEISARWMALVVFLALLHFVIEPLRWSIYLAGQKEARLATIFFVFFCTAFLTYVVPAKLGLAFRYWLITRYLRVSSTATALYMALDNTLFVVIWTAASAVLGGRLAYSALVDKLSLPAFIFMVAAGIAIVAAGAIALKRGRLARFKEDLRTALASLRPSALGLLGMLFVLEIAGFVVLHAAILAALSAPFLGWRSITTITILSMYAGFVSMLPMGLVGYDATIIVLLTQHGISAATALAVPVVYRAAIVLISLALGMPSSVKLGLGLDVRAIADRVSGRRAN